MIDYLQQHFIELNTFIAETLNHNEFAIGIVWASISGLFYGVIRYVPLVIYRFLVENNIRKGKVVWAIPKW